jgi:3-keto-5-aminohexanoate cleavage enzyme
MPSNKFILNFAPTGLIPMKNMSPYVPVSSGEIVHDVLKAAEFGANMVHLHARESKTGRPSHKKEIYGQIIKAIRKENKNIILCVSTSGRVTNIFDQRSDCLKLQGDSKPDCASLTLSSLNFNKQASINPPQIIQDLAAMMLEKDIKPELEVFDLGMINYAKYLIRKGLLRPPYYFNLILGNVACAQADMLHLGLMIKELPTGSVWSVGGVGNYQFDMNLMALIAGGGVRVGLEDNLWYDYKRTKLATNSDLVERIICIAKMMGRQPLTSKEARKLLDL